MEALLPSAPAAFSSKPYSCFAASVAIQLADHHLVVFSGPGRDEPGPSHAQP